MGTVSVMGHLEDEWQNMQNMVFLNYVLPKNSPTCMRVSSIPCGAPKIWKDESLRCCALVKWPKVNVNVMVIVIFLLQLADRQKHLAEERLRVRCNNCSKNLKKLIWNPPLLRHLWSLSKVQNYLSFHRRYGSSLSESEGSKPGRRHSHTIVSMTESDSPPQLPSPTRPLHPSSGKAPLTSVGESAHSIWLPSSKNTHCSSMNVMRLEIFDKPSVSSVIITKDKDLEFLLRGKWLDLYS